MRKATPPDLRKTLAAIVAAGATASALAAVQDPPIGNPGGTPGRSGDPVTLTGCVQRSIGAGSSNATGTAGAGGASAGTSFVLTSSDGGSGSSTSGATSSGTSTTGASGASTAAGGSQQQRNYALTGADEQLREHVGKRVQVQGTIVAPSTGSTGGATSSSGSATQTGAGGSASRPATSIRVASIKMISGTCP
jgi:hypothetical protein